jgi:hemerythrin-like domain-containing protein
MNELLQRLDRDHFRLAFVLALLEGLLDEFHDGAEPDYVVMCQLMEYLIDYADQVHHPSEDLIFNRLLERQGAQRGTLTQLMDQHRSLSQLNRRFKEYIEGIVQGEVLRRDEVEHQGRELIARLREHMSLEDEQAFPLARSSLSESDWTDLLAAAPNVQDPVFGHADSERLRAIFKQLKLQHDD